MTSPLSNVADIQYSIRKNAEEYKEYVTDLSSWLGQVKDKDKNIKSSTKPLPNARPPPPPRTSVSTTLDTIPRSNLVPDSGSNDNDGKGKETTTRIKSADYRSWDKFDVDRALNDLEDETVNDYHKETIQKEKAILESMENAEQAFIEKEKGNVCFKKGDYNRAITYYSKAIVLDPSNAVYYINRAMANLKLDKWTEVESDCERGIELDAKNVKAYWRRGIARRNLNKLADAKKDFEFGLVLEPTNKSIKQDLQSLEKHLADLKAQEQKLKDEKLLVELTSKRTASPSVASSNVNADSATTISAQKPKERPWRKRLVIEQVGDEVEDDVFFGKSDGEVKQEKNKEENAEVKEEKPVEPLKPVKTMKDVTDGAVEELKVVEVKRTTTKPVAASTEPTTTTAPVKKKKLIIEEVETPSSPPKQPTAKPVESIPPKPAPQPPQPTQSTPSTTTPALSTDIPPPKSMLDFEKMWKQLSRPSPITSTTKTTTPSPPSKTSLYAYLSNIPPTTYPTLFKSTFETSYLLAFIESVSYLIDTSPTHIDSAIAILEGLSRVGRFDMAVMFLGRKEKETVQKTFMKLLETLAKVNLEIEKRKELEQRLRNVAKLYKVVL